MATEEVFAGGAITTCTVQTGFDDNDLAFASATTPTGFPTGTHLVALGVKESGRVVSNVEKMLVTRSGSSFTVIQRGFDGTSAVAHAAGEAIMHVGPSAALLALLLAGYSSTLGLLGGKGQLIVGTGVATADNLAVGTNGEVLIAASGEVTGLDWGPVVVPDGAVTTAKLGDAQVTAAKLAAAIAGDGLTGGAGTALAVGAGTGIAVAADSVAIDLADYSPRWYLTGYSRKVLNGVLPLTEASTSPMGLFDYTTMSAPPAPPEVVMIAAGSILGVSVEGTAARSAGTATFEVYKNGAGTGLLCTIDGTNTLRARAAQARNTDTFVAGDRLGVMPAFSSFNVAGGLGVAFAASILCSL